MMLHFQKFRDLERKWYKLFHPLSSNAPSTPISSPSINGSSTSLDHPQVKPSAPISSLSPIRQTFVDLIEQIYPAYVSEVADGGLPC